MLPSKDNNYLLDDYDECPECHAGLDEADDFIVVCTNPDCDWNCKKMSESEAVQFGKEAPDGK